MVDPTELNEMIAASPEWLIVREGGRTFPLENHLVDITAEGGKTFFGFLDDRGWHTWRLHSSGFEGKEISLSVSRSFGAERETMRLVPRTSAAELSAEIELARLKRANEIADLVRTHFEGCKVERVALNVESGRLAQITLETADKLPMAAISDVTGKMTVEDIFASSIAWLDKLGLRKKKAINDLVIVCEKRAAKNAQKLHALLCEPWRSKLYVAEIDRKADAKLVDLAKRKLSDLWRQRSRRFSLPERPQLSDTASRIVELAPEAIDVVYSRQGETLRFHGLPFARVRVMVGKETAWFGTGRERRMLADNFDELLQLVNELKIHRSHDAANRRHILYRTQGEAWLESILRKNINLLDGNLILSPIYNQFRSANDKIDLLALRRDGRLVVIELKTHPDRTSVFQAADYWRKIELQRRRGDLEAADLFEDRKILDKPTLVYLVCPAWSFHEDMDRFAKCIIPEVELWRFELHEDWRSEIKVVSRHSFAN